MDDVTGEKQKYVRLFFKKITRVILPCLIISALLALNSCGDNGDDLSAEYTISLEKSELLLEIGSSQRLVATIVPADAENMAHVWTSETPEVATVDETGLVTARSVGTARIVARLLANNATAVCEVNVVDKIIHVQSIKLNSSEETIVLGDEIRLTATITPSNATDKSIVWTSQNHNIADVDDNGQVKAVGIGSTVIKASADNKYAECRVTVSDRTVTFSNIKYSVDDSSISYRGEFGAVGVDIKELGVCWTIDRAPTADDSHKTVAVKSPFVIDINNLTPKTSYYVRPYAKYDEGVYYGTTEEISTKQELVTDFKLEEAYKNIYDNKNEYTLWITTPLLEDYEAGIQACYGVAPHPEITDNLAKFTIGADVIYTLENLKAAQTYYIRAYSMKDNKPVYYQKEAEFSTIGKEVKLDAVYTGGSRLAEYWPYTINYTLPNTDDIYEVTINSYYGSNMGKSKSDITSTFLNVKGGSGSLYVEMKHYRYYDSGWNGSATVSFKNLTTGTIYRIQFGDYNRGF